MCGSIAHHACLSDDVKWRVGYNNGYTRRPPHFSLINEPEYHDGYETGIEDRLAGVAIGGQP